MMGRGMILITWLAVMTRSLARASGQIKCLIAIALVRLVAATYRRLGTTVDDPYPGSHPAQIRSSHKP